jgi:uncharacterized peroxidase-related enzyme
MAKIKVIEHEEATGRLKEIYDDLVKTRGKLADVHKIQSLRPESIVKHMDLYMELMFTKSELSRAEREMIAVVVSATNNCDYCQIHHAHALNHYWKDDEKIKSLRTSNSFEGNSKRQEALIYYAKKLTASPGDCASDCLEYLKDVGLTDNGILDATMVIAYFNFVNRIVLSLGVEVEEDEGGGYEY